MKAKGFAANPHKHFHEWQKLCNYLYFGFQISFCYSSMDGFYLCMGKQVI